MILSIVDLAAFAAECRPDWELTWIEGALTAARSAGWPDERILMETARLITVKGARPRDLTEAAREATWPASGTVASEETRTAALAEMRATLARDGAL